MTPEEQIAALTKQNQQLQKQILTLFSNLTWASAELASLWLAHGHPTKASNLKVQTLASCTALTMDGAAKADVEHALEILL